MVRSASLIFSRGGSGFSAATDAESEKKRCGCALLLRFASGRVRGKALGVTEGAWLSRPRSIARALLWVCLDIGGVVD